MSTSVSTFISISLYTFMSANPFKRSWVIVERRYVFKRRSVEKVRSGVQVVIESVAKICKRILILGVNSSQASIASTAVWGADELYKKTFLLFSLIVVI